MSNSNENPYLAPQALDDLDAQDLISGDAKTARGVTDESTRIRFWVRLVGVLAATIAIVLLAVLPVAVFRVTTRTFVLGSFLAVASTVLSAVLLRYGQSLSDVVRIPEQHHFETALARQQMVWRVLGISSVVVTLILVAQVVMRRI